MPSPCRAPPWQEQAVRLHPTTSKKRSEGDEKEKSAQALTDLVIILGRTARTRRRQSRDLQTRQGKGRTGTERLGLDGEGDLDVVLLLALAQQGDHNFGATAGKTDAGRQRVERLRTRRGSRMGDVLVDSEDNVLDSSLS